MNSSNIGAFSTPKSSRSLPQAITQELDEDHAQGPILPEIAKILPEAHAARIKRPGAVSAWAYPDFRNVVLTTTNTLIIAAASNPPPIRDANA